MPDPHQPGGINDRRSAPLGPLLAHVLGHFLVPDGDSDDAGARWETLDNEELIIELALQGPCEEAVRAVTFADGIRQVAPSRVFSAVACALALRRALDAEAKDTKGGT